MNETVLHQTQQYSAAIHMEVCKMIAGLPNGHLGGSLSIADALAVLYQAHLRYRADEPCWAGRDWVVMSKRAGTLRSAGIEGLFPCGAVGHAEYTPHRSAKSLRSKSYTRDRYDYRFAGAGRINGGWCGAGP